MIHIVSIPVLLLVLAGAATAAPGLSRELVEDVWSDHLLWTAAHRSETLVESEVNIRRALNLRPRNENAVKLLAAVYARKGEAAMAAMALRYGRAMTPSTSFWAAAEQEVLTHVEDLPEAPDPEAGLGFEDDEFNDALAEARHYLQQGNFFQAEIVLRNKLLEYPANPELLALLGDVYAFSSDWVPCAMVQIYALHRHPDQPDYANNLALALENLNLPHRALRVLLDQIQRHPETPFLLHNAGRLALQLDQPELALDLARRRTRVQPGNPAGWLWQARLAYRAEKYTDARRAAIQAMRRIPGKADPYALMSRISLAEGNIEEAKAWLRRLGTILSREDLAALIRREPFAAIEGVEDVLPPRESEEGSP